MARSAIRFHKQQVQFNTRIAELVDCDRHTVDRVRGQAPRPRRRRGARRWMGGERSP